MKLSELLKQIVECSTIELHSAKKLKGKKLEQFQQMCGVDSFEGDIYINTYNIILTDKADYNAIRYVVGDTNLIARLEVPEYASNIFVIRRFTDAVLKGF